VARACQRGQGAGPQLKPIALGGGGALRRFAVRYLNLSALGAIALLSASPARAQQPLVRQTPQPLRAAPIVFRPPATAGLRLAPLLPSDSSTIRPTHWVEGGLIGAAVAGAGFALLGQLFCEQNCTQRSAEAAVLGGALGFVIGALIGGSFPKQDLDPLSRPSGH
jgi:hypothetical protein